MNLDIRDPGLSLVDKQFRAKTKPCRSNFCWSLLIWYKTSRVNLEFETWGKLTNKISRFLKWSPIYNYLLNSVTSKTNLFRLRKTNFCSTGLGRTCLKIRCANFIAEMCPGLTPREWCFKGIAPSYFVYNTFLLTHIQFKKDRRQIVVTRNTCIYKSYLCISMWFRVHQIVFQL